MKTPTQSATRKSYGQALRHVVAVASHFWSSDVNRSAIGKLELRAGEHVLDIGAGLGPATFEAARRVRHEGHVTAIDPSRAMRIVLRLRRLVSPARARITVRDAVLEALPLPDHSLDAAIGLNVAHLLPDLDAAARELARVLTPRGRLVFVEEDLDDPDHTFHDPAGHHHGHGGRPIHDLEGLITALKTVGFAVEPVRHGIVGDQPAYTIAAARHGAEPEA